MGHYNNCCLVKLFVIAGLFQVSCVRINRLQVPEVARLGNPVVLDCEYTLEETKAEGLVVKWYFNEKPTPVYQWIANKKPQELGILKGRLNLDYAASQDRNSKHRALHILQPGPDLSGNYTCHVSTFSGEDRQTKRMLVLVPQKRLELKQENKENDILRVVCSAEGVYPKPTITLRMGNGEINNSKLSIKERKGLYDATLTGEVAALKAPEVFSCELHIPQANYTVKKETVYYPVNGSCRCFPGLLLQFFLLLLFFIFIT